MKEYKGQSVPDCLDFAFQGFGYSWAPAPPKEEKKKINKSAHLSTGHEKLVKYTDLASVFITYLCSSGVTGSLCIWKSWNTLEGIAK